MHVLIKDNNLKLIEKTMKKCIITLACSFVLLIGLTDEANSYMLDCEDLYNTCIANNPYDEERQFFYHYGYINGCSSSRTFCLEMN